MFSNLQLIIGNLYMCSVNKLVSNTIQYYDMWLYYTSCYDHLLVYNYMKTIKCINPNFRVIVKHFNIWPSTQMV